jgi:hypothetical protein
MLSILRIMIGLRFLEHGLAKILDFPPWRCDVQLARSFD